TARILDYVTLALYFFFFFFQAEDGIRDRTVTGVQTCALPISDAACRKVYVRTLRPRRKPGPDAPPRSRRIHRRLRAPCRRASARSEERRVGKEWRWRWGRG